MRINAPRELAEACLLYGWSVDECLEMPVTRFYAMLNAGREVRYRQESKLLMELCDVSSIALGDSKHYSELRSAYLNRALGRSVAAERDARAFNPADPKTGKMLLAMFNGGRA